MFSRRDNPAIVQSDRTILLEVDHPRYNEARDELARFAELEKSPEHIHTYRLSPISLWNAAAAGLTYGYILSALEALSRYEVPQNIRREIVDYICRYGQLKLKKVGSHLLLEAEDPALITEIVNHKKVQPYIKGFLDSRRIVVDEFYRGHIKQALIKIGFPVEDLAGYVAGTFYDFQLLTQTRQSRPFHLRPYQKEAVSIFHANGSPQGGSGVVVLPCGAGKTMVGMGAMAQLKCQVLILTTNIVALRQWRDELLDKSSARSEDIGEYSGEAKEIKPITLATYQILTYRRSKHHPFEHFALFDQQNWGLIIYDEVHLLPAPIFRITAEIQARRRLGLTATLVREDGREDDVFSLIGPKKYDVPWKDLERQGWIATAECKEIRVNLPESLRMKYATAGDSRVKYRIASENPIKFDVVKTLLIQHKNDRVLIIGQYLKQLHTLARQLEAPLITGQVATSERVSLYSRFRRGDIKILVVSKVANFAIDLPDANVAIQISGTFGSRQEEAQRLGRILRPKSNGTVAKFYSVVTRNSRDQDFSVKRQLFLTEQGYRYTIHDAVEFLDHSRSLSKT